MLVCWQEWEKNWLIQPWLWQTIKGIVTSNRHRLSITFGSRYLEIIKLFLTYAQTFLWPCCSGGRGEMLFGPDNLGDAAISGFLQKHSCGACCRRLGLTGQKMFSIAVCVSVWVCVREREVVREFACYQRKPVCECFLKKNLNLKTNMWFGFFCVYKGFFFGHLCYLVVHVCLCMYSYVTSVSSLWRPTLALR